MAETLLRYSVFNITLSNLNRFASFFFEHKSNIIPDISVSLEYFVSVGKQSYIDMRSVGGQLHIINQFSAQCDHRIILDISVSSEYSVSPREQVHFHMEDTCTSKSKFGALQAILHCFAQSFFVYPLRTIYGKSTSAHFVFAINMPHMPHIVLLAVHKPGEIAYFFQVLITLSLPCFVTNIFRKASETAPALTSMEQ